MKFAILLLAFVAVQFVVLVICASRMRKAVFRSPILGAALVFVLIEGLVALSLVLGAYSESRWETLSQLIAGLEGSNAQGMGREFDRRNNPGFLETLDSQAPALPSPDVSDLEAFEAWQDALRSRLTDDVFEIPGISAPEPVDFTVDSETTLAGGLIRKSITFSAFDGVRIPAYLFLPRASAPTAAIVVVPGHVREQESGIAQTAGLTDSYQHGAARALARAGFITLTFELRGFGQLGAPYRTEHRLVAYNAILAGTFYKAIITRDLKTAVDLLQSLPEVDADRLGMTGVSYGGEMSVTYAALDARIKAIAFQAFGGSVGRFTGVTGTRADQPHYCHIIPNANRLLRKEDLFLLLAPRPTLGIRGDEAPFREPGFAKILRSAWSAYGRPSDLELKIEKGGHEYFVEPAVDFFRSRLLMQ